MFMINAKKEILEEIGDKEVELIRVVFGRGYGKQPQKIIQYCYGDLYKGKQLELRLNLLEYSIQVVQQELLSRDEVIYEVR